MELSLTELVGYLASALVVTSLAMSSVVKLRAISLVGSAAFITYGALIGSLPIIATNTAVGCLNVWFLRRELGGGRDLGAVVVPPDSPFLADFLEHHAADIARFQPEYTGDAKPGFALVVTRDGLPAGVVLGTRQGERLDISLDYVLKAYRDSRLGAWLYGPGARVLRSEGIAAVTTPGGTDTHRGYLARVGFGYDREAQRYTRDL